MVAFIIILVVLVVLLIKTFKIVPQAYEYVVERLGVYQCSWGAGIHILIPILHRVVKKVSLKEQVADFEPQPVITKDNVTMMVDSVVYFQVFNSKLFTYGVERPIAAIENLSATTLRNIIGAMTLDETLTSRDEINQQITAILDEATDKWGIKVNRIEVKNIEPPRSIVEAMEKEMKAEREKRAVILTAEADKTAAITKAEGDKNAIIMKSEALKQSKINEAEAEYEAMRRRAAGIKVMNEANPSTAYLELRRIEAAEKLANSNSAKVIVPSELSGIASLAVTGKESAQ